MAEIRKTKKSPKEVGDLRDKSDVGSKLSRFSSRRSSPNYS